MLTLQDFLNHVSDPALREAFEEHALSSESSHSVLSDASLITLDSFTKLLASNLPVKQACVLASRKIPDPLFEDLLPSILSQPRFGPLSQLLRYNPQLSLLFLNRSGRLKSVATASFLWYSLHSVSPPDPALVSRLLSRLSLRSYFVLFSAPVFRTSKYFPIFRDALQVLLASKSLNRSFFLENEQVISFILASNSLFRNFLLDNAFSFAQNFQARYFLLLLARAAQLSSTEAKHLCNILYVGRFHSEVLYELIANPFADVSFLVQHKPLIGSVYTRSSNQQLSSRHKAALQHYQKLYSPTPYKTASYRKSRSFRGINQKFKNCSSSEKQVFLRYMLPVLKGYSYHQQSALGVFLAHRNQQDAFFKFAFQNSKNTKLTEFSLKFRTDPVLTVFAPYMSQIWTGRASSHIQRVAPDFSTPLKLLGSEDIYGSSNSKTFFSPQNSSSFLHNAPLASEQREVYKQVLRVQSILLSLLPVLLQSNEFPSQKQALDALVKVVLVLAQNPSFDPRNNLASSIRVLLK